MHPVLVTPPAVEPLSRADAKTHLRITGTGDDDYVDDLIVVARRYAEEVTHRALISQTWDLYLNRFPYGDSIQLPKGRLQSITSLKYVDSTDAESTVAASVYQAVTWEDPGRLILKYNQQWPTATLRTAGGVIVRFVCGFGDAATDVPEDIIHAMKLMIGHWYEHREEVVVESFVNSALEVPESAKALLWPWRIDMV